MTRIKKLFKSLDRPAFSAFIMGGDPNLKVSQNILDALPAAGADFIELGMPFTDPVADGAAIQAAGKRALANNITVKDTLNTVREFRTHNDTTPIILMGYANPLFSYGYAQFTKDASASGVDGLIVVDLPPEEDYALRKHANSNQIDMIRLITPTTDEKRLETLLKGASGFLYYVSIAGITGTKSANAETIKPHIDMIRSKTDLPIAIGFGIKNADDVKTMSALADAVIVGSAIAKTIEKNKESSDLPHLVCEQVKKLVTGLKLQ